MDQGLAVLLAGGIGGLTGIAGGVVGQVVGGRIDRRRLREERAAAAVTQMVVSASQMAAELGMYQAGRTGFVTTLFSKNDPKALEESYMIRLEQMRIARAELAQYGPALLFDLATDIWEQSMWVGVAFTKNDMSVLRDAARDLSLTGNHLLRAARHAGLGLAATLADGYQAPDSSHPPTPRSTIV